MVSITCVGPPANQFPQATSVRADAKPNRKAQLTLVGAFDFRPGATGGMYPANRQRMPSIFLPSLNWIEWHMMISPLADSSSRRVFTLARERPVPVAISASSRSPLLFRYWMMSCNLDSPSSCDRARHALVVAKGFSRAGQKNCPGPGCPQGLPAPANGLPTLHGVCWYQGFEGFAANPSYYA